MVLCCVVTCCAVRKEVETRIKNRASWIDDCLKSYGVHFPQYMATPVPDRADEQIDAWIKFLKEEEQKLEKVGSR